MGLLVWRSVSWIRIPCTGAHANGDAARHARPWPPTHAHGRPRTPKAAHPAAVQLDLQKPSLGTMTPAGSPSGWLHVAGPGQA
jgi:hypothetical protein